MNKLLRRILNRDKERYKVPRKVQDIIPVKAMWPDGMFLTGRNRYNKLFMFTDINFAVASNDVKKNIIEEYAELINSFGSDFSYKLSFNNRALNRMDFEDDVLMEKLRDTLDFYRGEFNGLMTGLASGINAIVQDKYVMIAVYEKDAETARNRLNRAGAEVRSYYAKMGSIDRELDASARLRILHDFFRHGEESYFHFDLKEMMKKGYDFRDYVCPDSFEVHPDYFKMGDRYGRALLFRDFASYISDDLVANMTDTSRSMMMSIDIEPVPMNDAIKEAEQRMLGVETNIASFQRKQNMNNNFSAVIPYDLQQQRKETREFLDDLVARDQRMFYVVITMVLTADTKEKLDSDTEEIMNLVRGRLNQMSILRYQQLDGLKTAVPFGTRCINAFRTLTTSSLAIFMPFRVQEIRDRGGIYYGQNVISRNLIIADRTKLLNGNAFIVGVSGGVKSFFAKFEIFILKLLGKADIIIIDPEREYSPLVKALGGSVIEISPTSPNHINAMDLSKEYSETDPIAEKSQFLQSLCEQIISGHKFSRGQQSIIDRCTEIVYRYYKQGNFMGTPPTLDDFRDVLLRQPEQEAHDLALELELFTRGSLNTFAKQTNVDTNNSMICYDIFELGEQLRAVGMLVILDSIMNRIAQNRQKGRKTFIYIDEIYLLFMHEYSAQFLYRLWKRVRKYGAYCTGITQNVSDMLQSHTARTMLSNSEFIVMLNQAATDRMELAKLLNISDNQLAYITNVEAGRGLMKIGSSLVPFENNFPKNTEMYKLMTTKFEESTAFRKQEKAGSGSNVSPEEEAEFRRKIQEVARSNEGFSDLVDRYLGKDD